MSETLRYPITEKLLGLQTERQAIGEFLEWLQDHGRVICRYTDTYGLTQDMRSTERLMADFFDVDLDELEKEKRTMLAEIRSYHENP